MTATNAQKFVVVDETVIVDRLTGVRLHVDNSSAFQLAPNVYPTDRFCTGSPEYTKGEVQEPMFPYH